MKELPVRKRESGSMSWMLRFGAVALVIVLWLMLRGGGDEVARETTLTGGEPPRGEPNTPPSPAPGSAPPARAPGAGGGGGVNAATCQDDLNCPDHQLCTHGSCGEITASTTECSAITLHFDPGSTLPSAQDQVALERAARCIQAQRAPKLDFVSDEDPRAQAAIAGPRARAVEEQLSNRGVTPAQLRSLSMGRTEETTGCPAGDAECVARRQRAMGGDR